MQDGTLNFNLSPGVILDRKYRIERILGTGGFGITYLASDLSLALKVAVKEFFPGGYCHRYGNSTNRCISNPTNSKYIERLERKFIDEARKIARLHHPNIISIKACFEENYTAYYVMEYIEGENLMEKVRNQGALPLQKAIDYIVRIGDAVEYIHQKRINHFDIKPANIMIRERDDSPILIDFGLSKQYDKSIPFTTTSPVGLSKGFAPIEQYSEIKEFSPQSDIYALGATLYFMITGKVPPESTTLAEESLYFPENLTPGIREVISKAMKMQRQERYATVNEFISSLVSSGKQAEPEEPIKETPPKKKKTVKSEKTVVLEDTLPRDIPLRSKAQTGSPRGGHGRPHWQGGGQSWDRGRRRPLSDPPHNNRNHAYPQSYKRQNRSIPWIIGGGLTVLVLIFVGIFTIFSKPKVVKLDATVNDAMHLESKSHNTYYTCNMLDGLSSTAWSVDASIADSGGGIDLLHFVINAKKLDHIEITNGYAKSQERFHQNARAGYVTIARVPVDMASSSDIIYEGPLQDRMAPQTIKVSSDYDNSIPTKDVYVRFSNIIHGDKYPDDFCISEIQFYGVK